jgi:hypothetical protein
MMEGTHPVDIKALTTPLRLLSSELKCSKKNRSIIIYYFCKTKKKYSQIKSTKFNFRV